MKALKFFISHFLFLFLFILSCIFKENVESVNMKIIHGKRKPSDITLYRDSKLTGVDITPTWQTNKDEENSLSKETKHSFLDSDENSNTVDVIKTQNKNDILDKQIEGLADSIADRINTKVLAYLEKNDSDVVREKVNVGKNADEMEKCAKDVSEYLGKKTIQAVNESLIEAVSSQLDEDELEEFTKSIDTLNEDETVDELNDAESELKDSDVNEDVESLSDDLVNSLTVDTDVLEQEIKEHEDFS